MSQNKSTDTVVVLGAGVIGLTTAVLLLENGFKVTILAEHFPGSESPHYTSTWAGAHWRSFADNTDHESIENDRETFFMFLELCKTEGEGLIKIYRSFEYWDQKPTNYQEPWFKGVIPKVEEVKESDLPEGVAFGIEYESMCINAPKYISWLKKRAEKLGGVFLERNISHIDECFLVSGSSITINCSGLGSLNLGGVEDKSLFPTRGQTILVNAPHVNSNMVKHSNT